MRINGIIAAAQRRRQLELIQPGAYSAQGSSVQVFGTQINENNEMYSQKKSLKDNKLYA